MAKKITSKKPQKRKHTRKKAPLWRLPRLSPMAIAAGVLLLLAGVVHLAIPDWPARVSEAFYEASARQGLRVGNIVVENRGRTEQQAIVAALAVREGDAILAVDIEAAQQRLQALPWVAQAVVARKLPDTLYVRLVEHVPVAVWQNDGVHYLLSQSGSVIDRKPEGRYNDLIILTGGSAPERAVDLLAMLSRHSHLRQRVQSAAFVGDRRWTLYFDTDLQLLLPEEQPFVAWDAFAAQNSRHDFLNRPIVRVDMRLSEKLVIEPASAAPEDDAQQLAGHP